MTASGTALTYQDSAGERIIQKQDVRTVKLIKNKHRLRNTLIVGAVGAGAGALIGAAANHPCSSQGECFQVVGTDATAGIGAVVGLLGGALVGVLLPSHEIIYSVNSRQSAPNR